MAYTISGSIVGSGSTNPVLPQSVNGGDSLTINIIPDTGWSVSSVLIDGVPIGAVTSHEFTDVYSDYDMEIVFEEIPEQTYTVDVQDNISGIISPGGQVVVDSGTDITFTLAASSGYTQTHWVFDGVEYPPATTFEIPSISANHSIGATFEKEITYAPKARLMRSEEVTISRRNFDLGVYNESGYRVQGPEYQLFQITVSKQPGQTQSGMLQAVGEQVRQEGDYDHIDKSWKVFSRDEIQKKDKIKFADEDEEYEVLDVDDWTVGNILNSINYRAMARRIKDR